MKYHLKIDGVSETKLQGCRVNSKHERHRARERKTWSYHCPLHCSRWYSQDRSSRCGAVGREGMSVSDTLAKQENNCNSSETEETESLVHPSVFPY